MFKYMALPARQDRCEEMMSSCFRTDGLLSGDPSIHKKYPKTAAPVSQTGAAVRIYSISMMIGRIIGLRRVFS